MPLALFYPIGWERVSMTTVSRRTFRYQLLSCRHRDWQIWWKFYSPHFYHLGLKGILEMSGNYPLGLRHLILLNPKWLNLFVSFWGMTAGRNIWIRKYKNKNRLVLNKQYNIGDYELCNTWWLINSLYLVFCSDKSWGKTVSAIWGTKVWTIEQDWLCLWRKIFLHVTVQIWQLKPAKPWKRDD